MKENEETVVRTLHLKAEEIREMVTWLDEASAYIVECGGMGDERRAMAQLCGLNFVRRALLRVS